MQPTAETQLEGDMYKNVLIALNDSQAAERALHRAIAMAEIQKGDLFVVGTHLLFDCLGGFTQLLQRT